MTTTKTSAAREAVPSLKDWYDVWTSIEKIGELQQIAADIEAERDAKVKAVEEQAKKQLAPRQKTITELVTRILAFANSHRSEIDSDVKRSLQNENGTLGWREKPIAITIRDNESVVAALKSFGFGNLVRVVEEPDKLAMRGHLDQVRNIKGITIKGEGEETFFVKPAATAEEVTVTVSKPKPPIE